MTTLSRSQAESASPDGADIFAIWLALYILGSHGEAFQQLCHQLRGKFADKYKEPVECLQEALSDEEVWNSIYDAMSDTLSPLSFDAKKLLFCLAKEARLFQEDDYCLTKLDLSICPQYATKDVDQIAKNLEDVGLITYVPELRGWRLRMLLHRFVPNEVLVEWPCPRLYWSKE